MFCPNKPEFAKLKLNYTMMGKRNLKTMVEEGRGIRLG
jgi:hypothetical protein